MFSPRLGKGTPEQVFVVAYNSDTYTLEKGHAVFWDVVYGAASTRPVFNGYSVRYGITTATLQLAQDMFAGVVANRDINPGEYGYVQQFGMHPGVYIDGKVAENAPYSSLFQTNCTFTGASLSNVILIPGNLYGNTTGGAAGKGYFGVVEVNWTQAVPAATATHSYHSVLAQGGPRCVPIGNPLTTISTVSTASVKAFIRAIG